MLNMIRHGAQYVFSSKGDEIVDQDIDSLLEMGESKTAQANKKLESLGESSLKTLTLDTNKSETVYKFEGEDFRQRHKDKESIALEWIAPPKRERKRATQFQVVENMRDMFYEGMDKDKEKKAINDFAPRPPKQPKVHDFQFFPTRLLELFDREIYYYRKKIGYVVPLLPAGPYNDDPKLVQMEEQLRIDEAVKLTPEEKLEKEHLLEKGFRNWGKGDFYQFVRLNERFGRKAIDVISKQIEGKTPEEVIEYSKVFWERCNELQYSDRIIAQIEKGEAKVEREAAKMERRKHLMAFIETKIAQHRDPYYQLKIPINYKRAQQNFNEDHDRFLICMLHKLGVESPDVDLRLLYAARKAPQFRFDWFLKSRSAKELYQRCQTIMNAFEYILDDKEVEALKEEREKLKSESQEKLNQQKVDNKEDWNSETDSEWKPLSMEY